MPPPSVPDVIETLRDCEVLDSAHLEKALRDGGDSHDLIERLVASGSLTSYQAEQLLLARGRGLSVGPYRILEPLGEGGMGQVFKALHRGLRRVVALKLIRLDRFKHEAETVERFQREARAAALLAHPNVVMVHDAGQIDDTCYLAMEYVEGMDLARMVKEAGRLPVERACDYARQAALGLQHAFEHGLVHRDIKPSNLLASGAGNRSARGPHLIKILDMGLARLGRSEDATAELGSLTRTGTVLGTPDYIAPEQARDAHRVDIRADIYSLGCTLYHLLAGQPPFPKGTVIEKLLMHQLDEPLALEKLRPALPPGTVALVRRAMAKRPADRFQTPAEMAQLLARASSSVLSLSTSAVPPVAAPERALRSTAAKPQGASPPRPDRAAQERTISLSGLPSPAPGGSEAPELLLVLKGHSAGVLSGAFTSDRNTLATGSLDGAVRIWDFSLGKARERAVISPPRVARTSPLSGSMFAVGEQTTLAAGGVQSLAFRPDGRELASGPGGDGVIALWDLTANAPHLRAALAGHRASIDVLAYALDGQVLASGGRDRMVRLWDLSGSRPKERAVLQGHTHAVKTMAFAPDGKTLASGSQDATIRVWHPHNRLWSREQGVLAGHVGLVGAVAFAPEGRTLASGGNDQTVRLWDLSAGHWALRDVLLGHKAAVRRVVFTADGRVLVSVDALGHVIHWEAATGQRLREFSLPPTPLGSLALTHDGRYLAAGGADGKVFVFRLGAKRRAAGGPVP